MSMASQEQLQQIIFGDNDDASTSSSSSSSSSSSTEEGSSPARRIPSSIHPKKRIKLSFDLMTNMPFPSASGGALNVQNEDKDDNANEEEDNDEIEAAAALISSAAGPQIAKPEPSPPPPTAAILSVKSKSTSPLPMHKPRSASPSPHGSSQTKRTNKRSLPIKKKKVFIDIKPEGDVAEVKAMVVDSDDGGEDDAVAAVVEETITPTQTLSSTLTKGTLSSLTSQTTTKKRPGTPNRAIRMPPFSSPGLLIPANSSQTLKGKPPENGLTTISSVFDQYLNMVVGYSEESRTKKAYVGSSLKRQIGDTFDSNVKFSQYFPRLVPADLVPPKLKNKSESDDDIEMNGDAEHNHHNLAESLIRAFDTSKNTSAHDQVPKQSAEPSAAKSGNNKSVKNSKEQPKKERKVLSFSEMIPVSLTLPYPDWFVQERIEYAERINERERAIIAYQTEAEALEYDDTTSIDDTGSDVRSKPKTVVPPLPKPPPPPLLDHLEGFDTDQYDASQGGPIYLPKSKKVAAYLDKDCFHIVDGRYFGLTCNSIADPHFVGPNAPGISGLNMSASNGLATAQSSSGGPVGVVSLQSTNFNSTSGKINSTNKSVGKVPTPTKVPKKKRHGLVANTSASVLRKIVEEGGELGEKMTTCIIRAAVHASRLGRNFQPFKGPPNGEIYPEVSKAYSAYTGHKPCAKCKSNKQGAYHCRLRRKHKTLDYDGTDSAGVIAPLFQVPMEELLWKL